MKHCLAETLLVVTLVALVTAGLLVAGVTLVDRIILAQVVTCPVPTPAHYAVSPSEAIPYAESAASIELPIR